jgi:2-dehydropantoate 2-reductase
MRIAIYGAGVIGGLLAAHWARGGQDVSVIARGPHLEAIKAKGLRIDEPETSFTVPLRASSAPADLGPQDLVVVTTKTPALPDVARAIGPLLGPDTLVAFSVNGVFWFYGDGFTPPDGARLDLTRLDPDGALRRNVGPERALGMVAYAGGAMSAPGVLSVRPGGRFVIGAALPSQSERTRKLVESLAVPGFTIDFAPEVRVPMWMKHIGVSGNQAISSLTLGNVVQVAKAPGLRDISIAIMNEARAVAAAHGFDKLDMDVKRPMGAHPASTNHKPSMLQDLELGRPMEIDAQYLILQDLARSAGVPTPTLDLVLPILLLRARLAGCYPA